MMNTKFKKVKEMTGTQDLEYHILNLRVWLFMNYIEHGIVTPPNRHTYQTELLSLTKCSYFSKFAYKFRISMNEK